MELDFSADEYARRCRELAAEMREDGLDALLIFERGGDCSNTRYLTGFAHASTFTGDSLTLVRDDGEVALITSAIAHGEPMHSNIQTAWLETVRCLASGAAEAFAATAGEVLAAWTSRRVGLHDPDHLPLGIYRALTALGGLRFSPAQDLVAPLRRVKSPAEIAVLRRLGAITAEAMGAAVAAVREGVSESEIAAEAHRSAIAAGAELMAFGCYVATGPRGALKNVAPRPDRFVAPGELVVIDLGLKLAGYQSDMSRNVVVGRVDPRLADMLDACDAALAAGKAATRPGVRDVDVVAAVREVIAERGFEADDYSICHSYGLDLVEAPRFDAARPTTLTAGMTFFVEPMIIPPHVGSVCIEDMIVVTDTGCETLTPLPTRHWPGA
ncbi:M24 family metallopeptidase [Acuticoccus mangrovi]|nr:Xaa-Pro peptidase family protein [Acuticoccus mangrovi]